jgi:hypothetical protein
MNEWTLGDKEIEEKGQCLNNRPKMEKMGRIKNDIGQI